MKLEMDLYNRLIEITGGTYSAIKTNDEKGVFLFDEKDAIEDLIEEFNMLQDSHIALKENIRNKIDDLESHKFLIDMIDTWTERDSQAWDNITEKIKLLESLFEYDRE